MLAFRNSQVVQKEIESRGKYVSSIQKLCERLGAGSSEGVLVWDGQRVRRVAATLERRWHALWLRSLEWQCVLEELIDKYKSGFVSSDVPISLNIDEEPLTKYPRLASDRDEWLFQPLLTMENESVNSEFKCPEESDENLDGSLNNDKGVMVGCTGIPELKSMCGGSFNHFEIVQDVGYSSESSTHLSNDERQDFIRIYSYSPVPKEKSKSDQACHHSLLPSPIETFGHFRGHHSNTTRTLLSEITLLQNKTLEQFPYFQKQEIRDNQKHSTWHVQEVNNDCFLSEEMEMNSSALSSSHLDTNSSFQIMPELEIFSLPAVTSSPRNNSDAVRQLVIEAEGLVRGSSGTNNKSANIHAWLQQCEFKEGLGVVSEAVESSCDASGECTTNDSECEDSFESNEMNCSLDLSRSGTGSVETVVPAKVEELIEYKNHTVGTDLSPKVARSKMQSAEYPPCNGVEYDQHNSWNFSSFSPKITYDRTTNVTSSPVQTRKHLKTKVQVNTLPIRKINRQYSQGSYSSVVQQSDSGSSSFSPSSKNTSFSSGCICCFDEAQRGYSCESSPKRGKNSSRCWKRASRSSRKSRSPKSGSASSVFKLNQIYDSHGINVSDISLGVNKELITGKYGSDKVTRSVKPTEEQGFQSDQAWDNFQEPAYLSEPYSESNAEDAVRKLEDYGEDYHAFLGCQSDSSMACNNTTSLDRCLPVEVESDSDVDDFHYILEESERALHFSTKLYQSHTVSIFDAEFAELMVTCRTYLKSLHEVQEQVNTNGHRRRTVLSVVDLKKLEDHISQWKVFYHQLFESHPLEQKVCFKKLEEVKNELAKLSLIANETKWPKCLEDLEERMMSLKNSLSRLHDTKTALLEVNLLVCRLLTDSELIPPHTKEVVTELYQLWDETFELTGTELTKMQGMKQKWKVNNKSQRQHIEEQFSHPSITEMQQEAIKTQDLPTKQFIKKYGMLEDDSVELQEFLPEVNQTFSDDQSKTDLGARQVGSCRKIEVQGKGVWVNEVKPPALTFRSVATSPDPSNRKLELPCKPNQKVQLWQRIVRFAVPIQVTLVLLSCLGSLLEPHCCDIMNNFSSSLTPQLRYINGPPPV
ncbi:uncharacterized protein LOC143231114 isoform X2 [Tachypleus tridentatus]|uniref:uncharacterized protein LOC143231114 isoform X2 n=1 Tax=Tachypleus tridentatus TaxID=6853 RepID=UPI003FD3C998